MQVAGLIEVTQENYYSNEVNRQYASVSQVKGWRKCPARQMAMIRGEYHEEMNSDALLVGSMVDIGLTEPELLSKFVEDNHDAMHGRSGVRAPFAKGYELIDIGKEDPVLMDYLSGDTQDILVGNIAGYPFRGKVDVINHELQRIVDLKTTASITKYDYLDGYRVPFYEVFGYWLQMAVYQELARQKYGKHYDMYIAALSKEKFVDKAIIPFGDTEQGRDRLQREMQDLKADMPYIKKMIDGELDAWNCGHCGYCRSTQTTRFESAYSAFPNRRASIASKPSNRR